MKKDHTLVIVSVLAAALFTGIVMAGLFARPVADDIAYLNIYKHEGSVLQATVTQYLTHSGRLSQVGLVYLFYSLFGTASTRIAPFVLAVGLMASLALLSFIILDKKSSNRVSVSLVTGVLLSSSMLITLPSLFDSLYWLTSSTVYVTSVIGLILTLCLILSVFKYDVWSKPLRLLYVAPIIILMHSFGEAAALASVSISALAVLATIIIQKKRHLIVQTSIVFISASAGFLVNFLSPGTSARRIVNGSDQSLFELIVNTVRPMLTMFSYVEWWHIAIATLIALFVFSSLYKTKRVISTKKAISAVLITLCGLLLIFAITFGVSAVSVGKGFSLRNYTLPHMALFIAMIIVIFIALCVINSKTKGSLFKITPVLIVLVALSSMPLAIYKQAVYIRAMAIRDSSYTYREVQTWQQINTQGHGYIEVEPVQVLISPTEAVDLSNPGLEQVDWFIRSIRDYYGIGDVRVIKPSETYCIPMSKYVKYELSCGNSRKL